MRFLYWNINGKSLDRLVIDLAEESEIDFVLLSECGDWADPIAKALTDRIGRNHRVLPSVLGDPTVITALPPSLVGATDIPPHLSIFDIDTVVGERITLCVAHLPSKLHQDESDQTLEASRIARDIQDYERSVGHSRTILVGDLNMNPFEKGVVGAAGLHAVMSRSVVARRCRTVQGRVYPFFYNPMWSHFGEFPAGPAGSYFYSGSNHVCYFWNIFDQVLLRPDILPYFSDHDLKIVSKVRETSLLNDIGTPNSATASDHLPLVFSIDVIKGAKHVQEPLG